MKKTVAGDDGGVGGVGGGGGGSVGDRKSLRNRRRRSAAAAAAAARTGAESAATAADDNRAPAQTVPLPPAATVTSGALQRLEAADDWLFTDWLDGGPTTSTYYALCVEHA